MDKIFSRVLSCSGQSVLINIRQAQHLVNLYVYTYASLYVTRDGILLKDVSQKTLLNVSDKAPNIQAINLCGARVQRNNNNLRSQVVSVHDA